MARWRAEGVSARVDTLIKGSLTQTGGLPPNVTAAVQVRP
jgi:hypothetical protein